MIVQVKCTVTVTRNHTITVTLTSTPLSVTLKAAHEEYERAGRYRWLVTSLATDGPRDSEQFRKLREAMKIVYWQKYKPIQSSAGDSE